jgi:hypothetical protein
LAAALGNEDAKKGKERVTKEMTREDISGGP